VPQGRGRCFRETENRTWGVGTGGGLGAKEKKAAGGFACKQPEKGRKRKRQQQA